MHGLPSDPGQALSISQGPPQLTQAFALLPSALLLSLHRQSWVWIRS